MMPRAQMDRTWWIALAMTLAPLSAFSQMASLLRQQSLRKWNVAAANYSGITHIRGDMYAVVSDKESRSGFYPMRMRIDSASGRVKQAMRLPFKCDSSLSPRDEEGICYYPRLGTLFISGEADQQVLEYDSLGRATGRRFEVPPAFSVDSIFFNCGFESLAYSGYRHTFFTVTERPLKRDAGRGADRLLRILEFGEDMKCRGAYAYEMEMHTLKEKAKYRAHGVAEIAALPDGRLVVMERELSIPRKLVGARCRIRLFIVNLQDGQTIPPNADLPERGSYLEKTLLADFTTYANLGRLNYANYEGMCLGPRLSDGRQTLLLINDSQAGAGNSLYHLKDFIRVLILR